MVLLLAASPRGGGMGGGAHSQGRKESLPSAPGEGGARGTARSPRSGSGMTVGRRRSLASDPGMLEWGRPLGNKHLDGKPRPRAETICSGPQGQVVLALLVQPGLRGLCCHPASLTTCPSCLGFVTSSKRSPGHTQRVNRKFWGVSRRRKPPTLQPGAGREGRGVSCASTDVRPPCRPRPPPPRLPASRGTSTPASTLRLCSLDGGLLPAGSTTRGSLVHRQPEMQKQDSWNSSTPPGHGALGTTASVGPPGPGDSSRQPSAQPARSHGRHPTPPSPICSDTESSEASVGGWGDPCSLGPPSGPTLSAQLSQADPRGKQG